MSIFTPNQWRFWQRPKGTANVRSVFPRWKQSSATAQQQRPYWPVVQSTKRGETNLDALDLAGVETLSAAHVRFQFNQPAQTPPQFATHMPIAAPICAVFQALLATPSLHDTN